MLTTPLGKEGRMSTEANKTIIRQSFEEGVNQHNVDRVVATAAADLLVHFPGLPEPVRGGEGLRQLMASYFAAFPDLQTTIEDLIAEGDQVVTRHTWRGTQQGEFQGIPPTGKAVTFTSIDLARLRDGQLVEQWSEVDT